MVLMWAANKDKSRRFYFVLFLWLSSYVPQLCAQESLRVVTEHLPPYQIVDNNRLVGGTSYLLMKEVLKRAGYSTHIEALPWARAYKTALGSHNVIIFSMTRSPEREHLFHWVGKLRELNYTFYTLSANEKIRIQSIEEALKYTVVAVRNSIEATALQKQGFVAGENLILTLGYIEAWQVLLKGRADITYANELIGDTIHTSLGPDVVPFAKQTFSGIHSALYVAASKQTSVKIVVKLRQTLAEIKGDGTLAKILSTQANATSYQ